VIGAIRGRSRRLRGALLAAVALAALAIAGTLQATGALHRVELISVDARFDVRGTQTAPDDLVVVGIDDRTFNRLQPTWPFKRSLHARVIDRLRRAGAQVIAYDIQFTEPSPEGLEAQDEALFSAIERAAGRILMATTETGPGGSTAVLGGDPFREALGAEVGNALTPADANGVVRRIRDRIGGLDTFAVVAARMAGARPERFGDAWIDFHGPAGTLDFLSFGDVHAGDFDPALVRGRIAVVGASAPSLQDVAATSSSGDELMSGPEIQAEAISTILRGRPLASAPGWIDWLLVVVLAVAAPLAAMRVRALPGFVGAVAGAGAYLGVSQLLFGAGTILPVVVPLVGLAVGAVGSLAALLVVEALERQRVRDVFSHFVPSTVVDKVLAQAGDGLRLGGVERECTVLFSDLRGFTTFSEGKPPDRVIEILNDYLAEMSDAILDHGGTLISFMGDGIMAVFGAPLDQPDHRDRAVEAARSMLARLDRFNARMRDQGVGEEFRMGIGINTGSVMCGNVGSERRLEYTAIGDTVNTASRIEGMTKDTGHAVHIAGATALGTQRADGFVAIAELPIRGRQGTVHLFGLAELVAPEPAAEPAESHR